MSRRPLSRSATGACDAAHPRPRREHLDGEVDQHDDEQEAKDAQVDPVAETRPGRRAEEDPDGGRARDVRVDAAADEVDDRAGGRGDADHHVARRRGDTERDAHREVHQRHLDDPAADPEQGRQQSRRPSPRPRRARGCGRDSPGRTGARASSAAPPAGSCSGCGSGSAVSVVVSRDPAGRAGPWSPPRTGAGRRTAATAAARRAGTRSSHRRARPSR